MNVLENRLGRRQRIVTQWEARRILASVDLPVVRETLVFMRPEAALAAREIGYPVVLRCWSPRGDAGPGAVRDLGNEGALLEVFDRLSRERGGGGLGFLVQETLRDERPLCASFRVDDVGGPSVTLGIGGVYRHLVRDEVRHPAPLSRQDAREMIASLRAAPLLSAWRGLPALSLESLASLLDRLGRAAASFPELSEICLERILARDDRPVCLDARVTFV